MMHTINDEISRSLFLLSAHLRILELRGLRPQLILLVPARLLLVGHKLELHPWTHLHQLDLLLVFAAGGLVVVVEGG